MADLKEKILEIADQPKSYENDGEKITNHSLQDLTAAESFLARRKAAKNPFSALKIARISTQGPEK